MTDRQQLPGGDIKRTSLSGQVVARIRGLVEQGTLNPGDQLPSEGVLATDLGVSRTIVREALKRLEGQGIITMATGRRAVIRTIDPELVQDYFDRVVATSHADGLRDVMEVRDSIEVSAAGLAAQRRTPAQLEELDRIVIEMDAAVDEPERYAKLDAHFHIHLAESTHNKVLAGIMASLRGTLETAVLLGLRYHRSRGDLMKVHALHRQIAEAIAAQDVDEARRLSEEHCAGARAVIINDGTEFKRLHEEQQDNN